MRFLNSQNFSIAIIKRDLYDIVCFLYAVDIITLPYLIIVLFLYQMFNSNCLSDPYLLYKIHLPSELVIIDLASC